MHILALAAVGMLSSLVQATYPLCRNQACTKCPIDLTSDGTGYPECVYYHSDVVTKYGPYPSVEGVKTTYWDFKPAVNHGIAVKSFDSTSVPNCGDTPIGCAGNQECLPIALDLFQDFFAVESCSHPEECSKIGCGFGRRSRRDSRAASMGGGIQSQVLRYANGSIIMPAGVVSRTTGEDMMDQFLKDFNLVKSRHSQRKSVSNDQTRLLERGRTCKFVTNQPDGYTEASSDSQVVTSGVVGPKGGSISHTVSTTVEFSSTAEAGLTFDIFSAGVSFTTSHSHTKEDSYTVQVPPGEHGSIYFTPTLICADGNVHCFKKPPKKATGCSPFLPNGPNGVNQGTYAFVSN